MALVRKTLEQIKREKPRVDRAKVEATTEADIQRHMREDDTPELTDEWFQEADIYKAGRLVRRGRPRSDNPKRSIAIRLDPDVLERLRATGPGWQTRINEVLRAWLDRSGP